MLFIKFTSEFHKYTPDPRSAVLPLIVVWANVVSPPDTRTPPPYVAEFPIIDKLSTIIREELTKFP